VVHREREREREKESYVSVGVGEVNAVVARGVGGGATYGCSTTSSVRILQRITFFFHIRSPKSRLNVSPTKNKESDDYFLLCSKRIRTVFSQLLMEFSADHIYL
jgi:hypothetical protein